jgi:hypothetical protein
MPMDERRRLANQAKVIVAEKRQTVEELKKCVQQSRALLAESKLLLAQSRETALCPHIRRLDGLAPSNYATR